jgi:predicted nucleic acid-binding protein
VFIAYPTLFEAYTLILFRLGKRSASRWLMEVSKGGILINPEPADHQRAIARLQSFPDQPITLFDSLVAELAMRLRAEVWTFDHHFDVMRMPVWRNGPG